MSKAKSVSVLWIGATATVLLIGSFAGAVRAKLHADRGLPALKVRFHQVGRASYLGTTRRYAYVVRPDGSVVLYDDLIGRQRAVLRRAGCSPVSMLGEVLAFSCEVGPPVELYMIDSGLWRAFRPSAGVQPSCGGLDLCGASLSAAGSAWLAWERQQCPSDEHCAYSVVFQNIRTGEVRGNPTGRHVIPDLNAPELARPVCQPLTVPMSNPDAGPSSLQFVGRFALATRSRFKVGTKQFLEECGSRLDQLIQTIPPGETGVAVALGSHAIVWQRPFSLSWVIEFLPSRRRFLLPIPNNAEFDRVDLALTDRKLYVQGTTPSGNPGHVWTAALPTRPPATAPGIKR
jgi:hypothetical protein